jgi:hypothetical protein
LGIRSVKIPVDFKERGKGWAQLMGMVKQHMEKGIMKDWGSFVGEMKGYCVVEGTEVEIGSLSQPYTPYVFSETHPVSSAGQVDEIIKSLS